MQTNQSIPIKISCFWAYFGIFTCAIPRPFIMSKMCQKRVSKSGFWMFFLKLFKIVGHLSSFSDTKKFLHQVNVTYCYTCMFIYRTPLHLGACQTRTRLGLRPRPPLLHLNHQYAWLINWRAYCFKCWSKLTTQTVKSLMEI